MFYEITIFNFTHNKPYRTIIYLLNDFRIFYKNNL